MMGCLLPLALGDQYPTRVPPSPLSRYNLEGFKQTPPPTVPRLLLPYVNPGREHHAPQYSKRF